MDDIFIFIVWDMNADSWSGRITMQSLHQTLEGALETIPENLKTPTYDRTESSRNHYEKNFTYLAIEKRKVGV